jgi:hypothetical protein
MTGKRSASNVRIAVTTHYEGLDADSIHCVEFIDSLERFLANVPTYTLADVGERNQDQFGVYLGFAAIDQDQTAVSAVLAFHEATTDIDYFLQHWTGYFANAACREKATNLASLLDEGIKSRIAQGWLDEPE